MPLIKIKDAIAKNPQASAKAQARYKARILAFNRSAKLAKKEQELVRELQALKVKGINPSA